MGIRKAAHSLQTTKNPNPKRFFSDLGIHDPKGSSRKEHLDTNHPRPRPLQASQKTGFLEIIFKRNVGLSNICYTIKYEII